MTGEAQLIKGLLYTLVVGGQERNAGSSFKKMTGYGSYYRVRYIQGVVRGHSENIMTTYRHRVEYMEVRERNLEPILDASCG